MAVNIRSEIDKMLKKNYESCIVNTIPEEKYITTSVPTLNYLISGKPLSGGFPLGGKISIIYGPEGGGKTSLVGFLLAEAQKSGLITVFIDTERALTSSRIKQFGIDESNLYHLQPDNMEQAFSMIEKLCHQIAAFGETDTGVLCVYDSIASTPTKDEMERKMEDKEYASQAGVLTRVMRRIRNAVQKANMGLILINQSRINMSTTGPVHGDKYTMPGGQALKHNCDIMIRMSKTKQDENGQFIKISTPGKNRLFKPRQAIELYFNYISGFRPEDNYASFVDFLSDIGYIGMSGAWAYWKDDLDKLAKEKNVEPSECIKEIKKFYKKDVVNDMLTDPEKYKEILSKAESFIQDNLFTVTQITTKDLDDPEGINDIVDEEIKKVVTRDEDEEGTY